MPPFVHRLRLRSKRSSRRPAAKAPHGLPGRSDRLRRLGLPALLALALLPLASAQETVTTLRETLARGQAALADGDYDGAYEAFEAIQETFGEEPEVRTESFRLTVLPVHGYAALLGGHPEAAVGLFEDFIDSFPEDRSRQGFVLFNLARAQSELGRNDEAIETYRAFVALDPDRPEAALSTLEAVRLMFKSDREDEAFDALDSLYARQPPGVLRTKARLTALQEALERGRVEQARDYMLESDWEVSEMPELAVLAFAALEMGNELLAARAYRDALRCYRLVPPFESLLEAQARRLAETRARFEERRDRVGLYQGGQFWTRFYSRLIARLEAQMKGLQEAEDYTPALYLSYGQAYLLDGRPREAWILFEYFARDPDLPKERQAEAHYRWILAAVEVGVWEDAFRIAEGFGERFPESPLVPDALFLLANAYQEAGQYADAIEVLTHFLANHDEHRLAPRARFVRGYNHNLMNQPVEAREDFDRFIRRYPDSGLLLDARFWRALTFFAERDYPATLEALAELAPEVEGGRLEPEVAYREAATLYAQGDYEAALTAIKAYLADYPLHSKVDEGRVLMGDIQMGRGELSTARAIFEEIEPSAGHLFTYSVFQAGKILRAVAGAADRAGERDRTLNAHLEHFQRYLERDDLPEKARISDALYWTGWTHIEQGDEDRARAVFDEALARYGNDMEAGEVLNIIDALARIEKRLDPLSRREREAQLKEWIEAEKSTALEDERLTYYARLNLYLHSKVPAEEPTGPVFEIVENVPMDQLDPQSLGVVASTLVDSYPRIAEDYLVKLEEDFPDSRHRSYAYYARAQLLMNQDKAEAARTLLRRFRAESPMHPLSIEANLLYADALTRTEEYEEAATVLEDLLKRRDAKGRPHARALLALSRNAEASGDLKRAVPYAQRVFNVYRAYPGLSARAYLMSAKQFEALDDLPSAYRTLDEMLADDRIRDLPVAEEAETLRDQLRDRLPDEALETADSSDRTATEEQP